MQINGVPKRTYQQNIVTQNLQNRIVRYTFTKKMGRMFGSIGSKEVILTFCPQTNELFYLKQDHRLPIETEGNLRKTANKDTAEVTRIRLKQPRDSNMLFMVYPKRDEKGKQSELEWEFQMVNRDIANKWYTMLRQFQDERNKIKTQQPSIYQYKPAQKPPTYYDQPKSVQNPPKSGLNNSQIKKTDSQVMGVQQNPTQLLMKDSKFILKDPSDLNLNQPPNSPARNSIHLPSRSNMANSGVMNNSKLNQSRIIEAHEQKPIIKPQDSKIKPQNQSSVNNDWNYRFVKNPTRETVLQFEQAAVKSYERIAVQSRQSKQQSFITDVDGFIIQVADNFTSIAKRLKNQYRNYHYIIQCCKKQSFLNVPLTCLIQHNGSICLVKAKFPKEVQKIKNKKSLQVYLQQLQHKTKISNNILFNNRCSFYDLTKEYGSYGQSSRIYVDDLYEYMPQLSFTKDPKDFQNNFFIRPQLMMYFQNRLLPGGNIEEQKNSKFKGDVSSALDAQIRDVADCLSSEQIYITNYFDLKQFFHYRGLNMKFLCRIYNQTKNKFVKRYLLTCLIAKLIKDEINYGLTQVIKNPSNGPLNQYVEQQVRYFIQGKTATTNQYWKRISLKFRDLYGTPFNTHELVGGFLLSCLMTLISAKYDLTKINKQKTIFRDQGIIEPGFIVQLVPKVKSYYRFSNKVNQTVEICKYSQQDVAVFNKLVQYMNLKSQRISQQYNVNKSMPYILGYLSQFIPPQGTGKQTYQCSRQIYNLVNQQPPSAPSLKITLNYLKQNLAQIKSQGKVDENFEKITRQSIDIINYWLQFQHPKICQFYQKIANYQQICGNQQQSLKILEKAIQISYKTEAKNSKKIGMRHYVAGCQYLKAGRKKQAIQNLQKAKSTMQKSQGQQHQHALVLLKLSSLHLNNGDTDTCIKQGKQALRNAQKGKMLDTYTIRICQILCRAYQIKGQKEELRKLSLTCAKDFNNTLNKTVFNQMVKICLTGVMARLNIERSKSLYNLACRIKEQKGLRDENTATQQLMQKAKTIIVMENFMARSDNAQKYYAQYLSKKPLTADASQFISILELVAGSVGIDFIEGLNAQKQFE